MQSSDQVWQEVPKQILAICQERTVNDLSEKQEKDRYFVRLVDSLPRQLAKSRLKHPGRKWIDLSLNLKEDDFPPGREYNKQDLRFCPFNETDKNEMETLKDEIASYGFQVRLKLILGAELFLCCACGYRLEVRDPDVSK